MSALRDPRDVLTVELDEVTELTCEFQSAEGLPDRPAELRKVVRLVGIDQFHDGVSETCLEVPPDAVRVADVKRRGA